MERRAQIITATRKVALARGLHDLRVADVAAELVVSTGLIHYHFATKHELLEAMLRDTAAEELSAVVQAIAASRASDSTARVHDRRLPPVTAPRPELGALDRRVGRGVARSRDPSHLRGARRRLGGRFAQVIAAGVESGAFHSEDPVAAAWRLCSLLDGLGLQVVLHSRTMSRAQMSAHVRRAAELELGYQLVGNARG